MGEVLVLRRSLQGVPEVGTVQGDADILRLHADGQPLLQGVQLLHHVLGQEAVVLLADGLLQGLPVVEAACLPGDVLLFQESGLDEGLQVHDVALEQEQVRDRRLGGDAPDLLPHGDQLPFDHPLPVAFAGVGQVAVAVVDQDAQRVAHGPLRHALEGRVVQQTLRERADAGTGVCVAFLCHRVASLYQVNSMRAALVSSLRRNSAMRAFKEQSFS